MKILDSVKNFFLPEQDIKEVPNTSQVTSQGTGYQRAVTPELEELDRITIRHDRRTKIQEVSKMVNTDGRIDRLLYKLSSDGSYKGFSVIVESAQNKTTLKQAQAIINRTQMLINTKQNMKGWIKGLIRDGDLFLQLIVDAKEREVIRAQKLSAEMTFTRKNAEGKFPKDKKPYYQEDPLMQGRVVKEFENWEIVHLRWDYEDGVPYGKPIFASSRLAWKRLDAGEKNMTIRRSVRAGRRLHHKVGTNERPGTIDDVAIYKESNKDTLENPMNPTQDFYSNGLVDIDEISGDTAITDIRDIEYFEGIPWIASGIPMSITGGGREVATNQNVVQEQEEDYHRVIGDIDETLEVGLRFIFDFALLLKNINPESVGYSLRWGAKDREDITEKIKKGRDLQELGFSFETVFHEIGLEGVTFDDEMKRIEQQIEDNIIPYGINTKIDPVLAALIGTLNPSQEVPTPGDPHTGADDNDEMLRNTIFAVLKEIIPTNPMLQSLPNSSNGNHSIKSTDLDYKISD